VVIDVPHQCLEQIAVKLPDQKRIVRLWEKASLRKDRFNSPERVLS